MRLLICLVCLCANPLHAQGFEAANGEFSFGSLSGNGGDMTSGRLTTEAAWNIGSVGLQFGGSLSDLGDEDAVGTVRAILTADLPVPLRLGVSVALATNDQVRDDTAVFGLHALYLTPVLRLDGALQLADHVSETGTFSFSILGEQKITQRIMVTTDLYRMSMDDELQDFYSVGLGGRYLLDDRTTLIAKGYLTAVDTKFYENTSAQVGVSFHLTPSVEMTALYTHLMREDGTTSDGASLTVRMDIGQPYDQARLFQSGPNADRFGIGAF